LQFILSHYRNLTLVHFRSLGIRGERQKTGGYDIGYDTGYDTGYDIGSRNESITFHAIKTITVIQAILVMLVMLVMPANLYESRFIIS